MPKPFTIGVFDSGFGGLTVLRELLYLIPSARFIYLGDTARLPYGSKSQATVARFAVSSCRFLLDHGADLLVIACNTATALALNEIETAADPTPVVGVIRPGAEAARASSPTDPVLVLATAATVASAAYTQALRSQGLQVFEKACPLLVPLIEEGWTDHPVTAEVARIYLSEALHQAPDSQTLLLGCTHYPLLKPLLAAALQSLGHPMRLIDSAHITACAVASHPSLPKAALLSFTQENFGDPPGLTVFATDSVAKFQTLGSAFLGQSLPEVQLVHLEE